METVVPIGLIEEDVPPVAGWGKSGGEAEPLRTLMVVK